MQHFIFTELVVVTLLVTWLLLSICYAIFNSFTAKLIYRFNFFKWISAYQLFTDAPIEYQLYYRDELLNGETTDWCAVILTPYYKWWHPVWYPGRFIYQTVVSTADDLMQRIALLPRQKIENISERFNYQVLLHYIFRQPIPDNLKARQFKIETIEQQGNSVNQFVSKKHTP